MSSEVSVLTANSQEVQPLNAKKRTACFTHKQRFKRIKTVHVPEELFEEFLPKNDYAINVENCKKVADYLMGFLNRYESQFTYADIDSLRQLRSLLVQIPEEQSENELNSLITRVNAIATALILKPLPLGIWEIVDSFDRGSIAQLTPLPFNMTVQRVRSMTPEDVQNLANEYAYLESFNRYYINRIECFFKHAKFEPEKIQHFFLHLSKNLQTKREAAVQERNKKYNKLAKYGSFINQAMHHNYIIKKLLELLPCDLETLNLSGCKHITNYHHLSSSTLQIQQLKVLNISHCGLNADALTSIFYESDKPEIKSLFCTLEEIDLSHNDLINTEMASNYVLKLLSANHFPHLKRLCLYNCNLSEMDLDYLQDNLPEVEIVIVPPKESDEFN